MTQRSAGEGEPVPSGPPAADPTIAITHGPTWDHIRASIPSMSPRQRDVAEALLAMSTEDLAAASAQDVATRSGTSAATVVRTCQQLGFAGFRECAMRLAFDVEIDRAAVSPDRGPDAALDARPSAFMHALIRTFRNAAASVDDETIATVAARLATASRIQVVALGWSAGAGDELEIRLASLGLAVEGSRDFHRQVTVATSLGPGDVCVIIAFTGSGRVTELIARRAREHGATVVLISTFARSRTAAHADHNVIFPIGIDEFQPNHPAASVAQFAMVDAIYIAVAAALDRPPWGGVSEVLEALIDWR